MARSLTTEVGTPSAIAVGLTSAVALASWFVFIRGGEPDWGAFAAVFEGAIVLNGAIQFSLAFLDPRLKTRRSRTTGALVFTPILLCFAVFAAFSAGVSAEGFDDDTPVIGAVALLCFLAIAAALIGLLIYFMVVLPVMWLLRAINPKESNEGPIYLGMGRGELVAAALIFAPIIAFAIAMANMVPGLGGSPRGRRPEQFVAFITFQGEPVATIVAWLAIASIVAALLGYRRARRTRLARARA